MIINGSSEDRQSAVQEISHLSKSSKEILAPKLYPLLTHHHNQDVQRSALEALFAIGPIWQNKLIVPRAIGLIMDGDDVLSDKALKFLINMEPTVIENLPFLFERIFFENQENKKTQKEKLLKFLDRFGPLVKEKIKRFKWIAENAQDCGFEKTVRRKRESRPDMYACFEKSFKSCSPAFYGSSFFGVDTGVSHRWTIMGKEEKGCRILEEEWRSSRSSSYSWEEKICEEFSYHSTKGQPKPKLKNCEAIKPLIKSPLIDRLVSSKEDIRNKAFDEFKLLDKKPQEEIAILLADWTFSHKNGGFADRAREALKKVGPVSEAAIPELIHELRWRNQIGGVLKTLGDLGPYANGAVPALMEALEFEDTLSSNKKVFRRRYQSLIITALGKIGPEASKSSRLIVRVIEWNKENLRLAQSDLEALGKMGPKAKSAVPILVDILEKDAEDLFWIPGPTGGKSAKKGGEGYKTLIETLGKIGPKAKKAVPVLLELSENDTIVQRESIEALIEIVPKNKRLHKVLIDRFKPGRYSIWNEEREKNFAIVNLLKLTPHVPKEIVPKLIPYLKEDYHGDRTKAIALIGMLGKDANETVPHLRRLLNKDYSNETRKTVAESLQKIGDKEGLKEVDCAEKTSWGCDCVMRNWGEKCPPNLRSQYGNKDFKPIRLFVAHNIP